MALHLTKTRTKTKTKTNTNTKTNTKNGSNQPLGGCRGEAFIYVLRKTFCEFDQERILSKANKKLTFSPNLGSTYSIETCL